MTLPMHDMGQEEMARGMLEAGMDKMGIDFDSKEHDKDLSVLPMAGQAETRSRPVPARRVGTRRMRMTRGITLDSGAADHVMPRRMVRGKMNKVRPSPGSQLGMHYLAANNGRIHNEGEADFKFTTEEGNDESYVFQVAEVNKVLCAVSYLVDKNNRVTFDRDEKTGVDTSQVFNKTTGKMTKLRRDRNVRVIDAYKEEDDQARYVWQE